MIWGLSKSNFRKFSQRTTTKPILQLTTPLHFVTLKKLSLYFCQCEVWVKKFPPSFWSCHLEVSHERMHSKNKTNYQPLLFKAPPPRKKSTKKKPNNWKRISPFWDRKKRKYWRLIKYSWWLTCCQWGISGDFQFDLYSLLTSCCCILDNRQKFTDAKAHL